MFGYVQPLKPELKLRNTLVIEAIIVEFVNL